MVLDILAETITTDGSKGEKIPSAESTGLFVFAQLHSILFSQLHCLPIMIICCYTFKIFSQLFLALYANLIATD